MEINKDIPLPPIFHNTDRGSRDPNPLPNVRVQGVGDNLLWENNLGHLGSNAENVAKWAISKGYADHNRVACLSKVVTLRMVRLG